MHLAYLVLLLAVPALAAFRLLVAGHDHESALVRCIGVVVLNWFVNTLYVIQTGNTDAVEAFMFTDAISLWLVTRGKSGFELTLASLYLGQIIAHGFHWGGGWSPWDYWFVLTLLGIWQLAVLGFWALAPAYRSAWHELS